MAIKKLRGTVKLRDIERREQEYSELVVKSLRKVINATARQLNTNDIDDLNVMKTLWRGEVEETLKPAVAELFVTASRETANAASKLNFESNESVIAATVPAGAAPNPEALSNESLATKNFVDSIENPLADIGDDAWSNARNAMSDGVARGLSIPNISSSVRNSLSISSPRATMIARTTVVGASNAGSIETMRNSGLVVRKEWIATHDSRTRPTHLTADGQVVDLNENFSVGGASMDHPGDRTGPADEVINCRCTIGYEVSDDEVQQEQQLFPEVVLEGEDAYDATALKTEQLDLEDFEREVFARYGANDYAAINRYARWLKRNNKSTSINNVLTWFEESGLAQRISAEEMNINILMMDQSFDFIEPIDESLIAYRGINDLERVLGEQPWTGTVFADGGFMSTSTDKSVASFFTAGTGAVLKIKIPAGSKVINMKSAGKRQNTSENELLLERGSKLKIVGVRELPDDDVGQWLVDAELVQ